MSLEPEPKRQLFPSSSISLAALDKSKKLPGEARRS
jgi:hypothetical protein